MLLKWLILMAFGMFGVNCNVFLHNMRGSNNRLNEDTGDLHANRRLFDSQNHNKGGYNVGVNGANDHGNKYSQQYNMEYFQSSPVAQSKVFLEWTMQHGCGGGDTDNKLNCNLVLQYMCEPDIQSSGELKDYDLRNHIRDGRTTQKNHYNGIDHTGISYRNWVREERNYNHDTRYGMHEPYQWYVKCKTRDRNKGLFTADQNLNGDDATHTRQNPSGLRAGYECPEERDYYPYWHPTDWKDIVVFAQDHTMCSYFQKNSFNVKSKWECVEDWKHAKHAKQPRHFSKWNNEEKCLAYGGQWLEFHNFLEKVTTLQSKEECEAKNFTWGRPIYGYRNECLVPLKQPDCVTDPWTRANHLGNGVGLKTPGYVWNLPHFPSGQNKRCVLRIRYNISSDDYPRNTPNTYSQGSCPYPYCITNDPTIDIAGKNVKLKLNTAQLGRTFQDRSHVFKLIPRPSNLERKKIYNINVIGKRGRIAQVYPAVPYDFSPKNITIAKEDFIHIQWTGSNMHSNRRPSSGGVWGADGEGRKGTDRHNVLGIAKPISNLPLMVNNSNNIFTDAKIHWPEYEKYSDDIFVQYASAGYYKNGKKIKHIRRMSTKLDSQLNNASPSYRGMVLQLKPGTHHYVCTRNNNFSFQSQKGVITVK